MMVMMMIWMIRKRRNKNLFQQTVNWINEDRDKRNQHYEQSLTHSPDLVNEEANEHRS